MKGFNSVKLAWGEEWNNQKFKIRLLSGLLFFLLFPWKANEYFHWVQGREGVVLNDWVLKKIPSFDVSIPIFTLIYTSVIYLIYRLLQVPNRLLWFVWAFNIETLFRFLCIYLVPLNPPIGMIDLHDPVAALFIYGNNTSITKDLFFSGHTATMMFLCYFLTGKLEKILAYLVSGLLIMLLLFQHIHYSVDIIGAPIFTFLSILLAKKILKF